jgi:hypothetical protein
VIGTPLGLVNFKIADSTAQFAALADDFAMRLSGRLHRSMLGQPLAESFFASLRGECLD